ncbi:MAG: MBL fold metallo-hydrolase [Thermoanaerobaculia bacterium]
MTEPRGLYEQVLAAGGGVLPQPRPPRPSAAIVPWRRDAAGAIEVFWLERGRSLPFMAGWRAFPGGALDRSDAGLAVAGAPAGISPGERTPASADGDDPAPEADLIPGIVACALRELAEETGVRPVRDGLPDGGRLEFAGRWLTPPLTPVRFDNRFFLLAWRPDDGEPHAVPPESASGEWIRPAAALAAIASGDALAAPPIVHLLRVLAEEGPEGAGAARRLRDTRECNLGPLRRIEFRPGILTFPLAAATLPPATHTNCYLLGTRDCVLIDPGSPFPEVQRALSGALSAAAGTLGREVRAIWLSHHHPDHVAGVAALREELGLPVYAHAAAALRLREVGIAVDGELVDGELVALPGAPGEAAFTVRVLHTPGHARGHLAFEVESSGSILAGDLVAGAGTIVIDPPEGEMSRYLDSLAALEARAPRTLFVSHGAPFLAAADKLREYRAHRLEREAQVLRVWREKGLREPAEFVPEVYPELAPAARPLAERQVRAHLVRLAELGEIAP